MGQALYLCQWGQVEELLHGCGLAKAQTYSERTLLETHRVTHTHLSTWSHQGTLDTHIHILLTLGDIHSHPETKRHTQKHSHTYLQAFLHPSISHTKAHGHTRSCIQHPHRQKGQHRHTLVHSGAFTQTPTGTQPYSFLHTQDIRTDTGTHKDVFRHIHTSLHT